MLHKTLRILMSGLCIILAAQTLFAATTQKRYYAYPAVEDKNGVIAPWYQGLNGQCDLRLRIAAETLKRYPWTPPGKAPAEYPEYIWNGHWGITPEGVISTPPFGEWDNGDMGQRAAYVLNSLTEYYRYTGDPAAIAHITWQADFILDYMQTDSSHPWPNFLISVPFKGKQYGKADPKGMIQLDIVAENGIGLLKAYQLTGNKRYFDAVKHWADLIAEHRDPNIGLPPWPRYANPENAPWPSFGMTGGVAYILYMFDELIRLGYTGPNNSIVVSRDFGRAYLRDTLLPKWTANDTWGYNYWDVPANWQQLTSTEFACRYMMDNKDYFPNWRNDVRNILTVFLNRTSAHPAQRGEVYSGAWAYPESFGCCGRSLWYTPLALAMVYAQYGSDAGSEWGRELARRQQILAGYDIHETGVSEDNIDGGQIVNGAWFKIAHPMALKYMLGTIGWMPAELGANRENHIVRSTSVVNSVVYGKGKITYTTFDSPAGTTDYLRLAFTPDSVKADGKLLKKRTNLNTNGYAIEPLSNGDCIFTIRHDGAKEIKITGPDPQMEADNSMLVFDGQWYGKPGETRNAYNTDSAASFTFTGNQVRVIGSVKPDGGKADVYIDGVKQLVGIDCWNPSPRNRQVLYYKNGLSEGQHTIKIVATGTKNPYSKGANVYVETMQWSAAAGKTSFGEGGGETGTQRWIFGYTNRNDYIDSNGNRWRPGTEFALHDRFSFDSVADTWWTNPVSTGIGGTNDQELYKYGVHSNAFSVNFTVGPGTYHALLKFAATRNIDSRVNCITILINGKKMVDKMDVVATAQGLNEAVDLVFNGIKPRNGMVEIRFIGGDPKNGLPGEAFIQAIEVGPGNVSGGLNEGIANPRLIEENLLINPGFEDGIKAGKSGIGWKYNTTGDCRFAPESSLRGSSGPDVMEIGSGKESLRVSSDNGGTATAYQDILVNPNSEYRASVWVRPRYPVYDYTVDHAGFILEEYNSAGKLVSRIDNSRQEYQGYTYLEKIFETKPDTRRVRFILIAVLDRPKDQSITFDNCVLDGKRVPSTITGRVAADGKGIAGVKLMADGKSAVTASDGTYKISGLSVSPKDVVIRASKDGFFSQQVSNILQSPSAKVDFNLVAVEQNRLLNAGFDDGWNSNWIPASTGKTLVAPITGKVMPSGYTAVRISQSGNEAGWGSIRQRISVQADTDYTASAEIAVSNGEWGSTRKAGLLIEEFDRLNNLIIKHPVIPAKGTGIFGKVEYPFHTDKRARYINISGYAEFSGGAHGYADFDSFVLDGPVGPSNPPLSGVVTSAGRNIPGVEISIAAVDKPVMSGDDGYYSADLKDGVYSARISKDGYYTQRRKITVKGNTVTSFELIEVGGNLLVNAGFDDGWPDGWMTEIEGDGLVRAGHTPSLFSPMYPLFFQTGEEATEIGNGSSKGGGGRIFQKVSATPDSSYIASAWFRGYGPKWGKCPYQKAGLFVHELDSEGNLVKEHPVVYASRYDDWTLLTYEFKTSSKTTQIKIGGYAHLTDNYNDTTYRALFDTFTLKQVPASDK
ncbi:MAG: carboxypeptidase regulatory-like domain-containing protein [Armatimonadota bacterium]